MDNPEILRPLPTAKDGVLRVVLDTNVLVSLFVFADSCFTPLRRELEAGRWQALTSVRCLGEFRRVLAYPMFSLDAPAQAAALGAYAGLAQQVDAIPESAVALPRCKDPDDQKFLELARDGHADWLVTSDKALLKLARRDRLRSLFRILAPEKALELLTAASPGRPEGLTASPLM